MPVAPSLYKTIITPSQSPCRNVLSTTVCSTSQALYPSSIMASMENKSNKSSKSEGKMTSKAQRFASLDGLEEYEKDDIHSYLNKLLAAMDVVEANNVKNRPITRLEQSDIDDNLQKLHHVVLGWAQRPRPSPPVLDKQRPPSLGLEARRLIRKLYIRIQDGLEDDKVM